MKMRSEVKDNGKKFELLGVTSDDVRSGDNVNVEILGKGSKKACKYSTRSDKIQS